MNAGCAAVAVLDGKREAKLGAIPCARPGTARRGSTASSLDLQMPVVDGRTFYRELRARGHRMPVVILSAFGAHAAQRELGAAAAVAKPFEPDDLVERDRADSAVASPRMRTWSTKASRINARRQCAGVRVRRKPPPLHALACVGLSSIVRDRLTVIRGLYVIIDPDACRGRDPVGVAELALEGGASVIQWRDKRRDKRRDKGERLDEARAIAALCRARHACFIFNDHADLAIAAGADGVHVGQKDLPVALVRAIVDGAQPSAAARMIIGASTNTIDEAQRDEAAGADYVAVGAIFPTASKDGTRPASLERVREVKAAVRVPVVAIGGIDASNIRDVVAAGADAAAVIRAVCAADEPRAAAHELASCFKV